MTCVRKKWNYPVDVVFDVVDMEVVGDDEVEKEEQLI